MRKLLLLTVCFAAISSLAMAQVKTSTYVVDLSPSQAVPPVADTDASGTVVVTINTVSEGDVAVSGVVDFRVMWSLGQPETLRAMHIHRGGAEVAGPVVIGSVFGTPFEAGPGSGTFLRVSANITDPMTLAIIEEIRANPADFYVNIHTTSNPRGHIRGQLRPADHMMLSATQAKLADMDAKVDNLTRVVNSIARRLGLI